MNEEQPKTKEKKTERAEADIDSGDKSESVNLVEQANTAAERLERGLKRQEELLAKQQALDAERLLGGRASFNDNPPTDKEIDPVTYSKMALKGNIPKKE